MACANLQRSFLRTVVGNITLKFISTLRSWYSSLVVIHTSGAPSSLPLHPASPSLSLPCLCQSGAHERLDLRLAGARPCHDSAAAERSDRGSSFCRPHVHSLVRYQAHPTERSATRGTTSERVRRGGRSVGAAGAPSPDARQPPKQRRPSRVRFHAICPDRQGARALFAVMSIYS